MFVVVFCFSNAMESMIQKLSIISEVPAILYIIRCTLVCCLQLQQTITDIVFYVLDRNVTNFTKAIDE